MSTELGAAPPRMTEEQALAVRQMILDAAKNGESAPVIRALVKHVTLTPEQQLFVDSLLDAAERAPEGAEVGAQGPAPREDVAALRAELADLRQANDTMAFALGACPYCWGGDLSCRACRGRGRPGYAPPDPALFQEFVVPALRRVRDAARQRPDVRAGFRGARG